MNTTLMAEAGRLDEEASLLVERASELRREASQLRLQATQEDRHVKVATPKRKRTPRSTPSNTITTTHVSELMNVIESVQPASISSIAEHLGVSETRARALCAAAEEMELVTRTGAKTATRWRLVGEEGEVAKNVQTPEARVRSSMVKLDEFTLLEIALDSGETQEVCRRYLTAFEERGWCSHELIDATNLYQYLTPEREKERQRKRFTPAELAVVDRSDVSEEVPEQSRSKHRRQSRGTVSQKLVKEVVASGGKVVPGGKHLKVLNREGQTVGTLGRGKMHDSKVKAARREIRRGGLKV